LICEIKQKSIGWNDDPREFRLSSGPPATGENVGAPTFKVLL
jgi:hypothetical protein